MNKSLVILLSAVAIQVSAQQQSETTNVESLVLPEQTLSFSERNLHLNHGKTSVRFTPSTSTTKSNFLGQNSGRQYDNTLKTDIFNLSMMHTLVDSNISFSLSTGFGNTKNNETLNRNGRSTDTEYKSNGMTDMMFNLQNLSFLSNDLNFIFGSNLNLSPGTQKLAGTKTDGNMYSGGNYIEPYIGLESNATFGVLGAKIAYKFMGEQKSEFSPTSMTATSTGFNELTPSVFFEKNISSHKLGAFIEYAMIEKGSVKEEYTSSPSFNEEYDLDAKTTQTLGIYGSFVATRALTIVPQVSLATLQTKKINGWDFDKQETVNTSIELRATF